MSTRNIHYLVNYIGPVLLVNKLKIKTTKSNKKVTGCTNHSCVKYSQLVYGFPNFCTTCGSKIGSVVSNEKIEVRPGMLNESFYSEFIPVSQKHFNGIEHYIKDYYFSDNEIVYVPYIDIEEKFEFGICSYQEFGKICNNKNCEYFEDYTDASFDYCCECGSELELYKDYTTGSVLSTDIANSILSQYTDDTNFDSVKFIENEKLLVLLKDYKQTPETVEAIKLIEKTYGKGSVDVVLMYVRYHQNY